MRHIVRIIGLLILLQSVASVAFGADIKIDELPAATSLSPTDVTVIVQSGVTKQAAISLMRYTWRGEWVVGTTYAANDLVMVSVAQGEIYDHLFYISKAAGNVGHTPSKSGRVGIDDTYWYTAGGNYVGSIP